MILLRGGDATLEVLLVQRNPAARFMGGAWVFPGGAVDASEDARGRPRVREVAEEAASRCPTRARSCAFSRWITPAEVRIRFDTRFFLAARARGRRAAAATAARPSTLGWYAPQEALDAHGRDELELVFPTIKTLEQLAGFGTADELLAWADGRAVEPIEPQVVVEGEVARVVLPGEPGYRD